MKSQVSQWLAEVWALTAGARHYLSTQRYAVLTMLFVGFVCVTAMMVFIATVTFTATPPPPPFEYSAESYLPEQYTLCRGKDPLVFHFASQVNGAPYSAYVTRAIYRFTSDSWELALLYPSQAFPVRRDRQMTPVSRLLTETVTLPVGMYEFQQNAQTEFSRVAGFSVPFRVVDCK